MIDQAASFYENLRAGAMRRPEGPAFTFLDARLEPTAYRFAALFERAEELGRGLRELRLNAAAPLGLLLHRQEAQVLHYLAALSAGLVPAILTPPNPKLNLDYYRQTIASQIATCGFSAVISDVKGLELAATQLAPFTLDLSRHVQHRAVVDLQGASILQFSSGTTGIKKGVLVSKEAVLQQLEVYGRAIGLTYSDCIVSWLPLYHDMGFMACLNMPLLFGVHCVMLQPLDWVGNPAAYLHAASRYRATLGWNPNFAYAFMAERTRDQDLPGIDLSFLRALVNCSEPTTAASQERFLARFAASGLQSNVFRGCYAMAETSFAVTHGEPFAQLASRRPGRNAASALSVGEPLPGVEIKAADAEGVELDEGRIGELWVRSPFNFLGYFNNEAATREAIRDGWYRTGDLGYREGTRYYVCGRAKDLMIVNGVNIFPQDVEDIVSSVAGVYPGRVAAFAQFDERNQTERVTVLAESDQPEEEHGRIILQARQRLLAELQIANFEVHLLRPGWLVKSTSGKMARAINQQKWLAARAGMAA